MAFGRVCLIGDAACVVRPARRGRHGEGGRRRLGAGRGARQGTTTSTGALADVGAGPAARWAAQLLERTRRIGRRSQVDSDWVPGDPELIFGLQRPGAMTTRPMVAGRMAEAAARLIESLGSCAARDRLPAVSRRRASAGSGTTRRPITAACRSPP